MSSITETIHAVNQKGESALIPFLTAGFPEPEMFVDIAGTILDEGGDLLEVGIPFSDPLADGPTIQASSQVALRNGLSVSKTFELVQKLRGRSKKPIILMTYFNPVLAFGVEKFAKVSKEVGVSGVIIPDLPPEEAREWKEIASESELDTIFLVAPTTNKERLPLINGYTSGFIYYVTMTGVTGATKGLPEELLDSLKELKRLSRWPVAVGFGISSPEQVALLSPYADGIIIGSAIIREIQKIQKKDALSKITVMIKKLKQATRYSKEWMNIKIPSENPTAW